MKVAVYLSDYPINHRPKSVVFSKQRLAHVKRLLGVLYCQTSQKTASAATSKRDSRKVPAAGPSTWKSAS